MNMHDFIQLLKSKNELIEINEFVSPELEITEIVDRISKSEFNKALLFKNNGTEFPILINAFGTEKRMAYALHAENLNEVQKRIEALFDLLKVPQKFSSKISILKKIIHIGLLAPKVVARKGKCQQVINLKPDLSKLPILKCWPNDGGRFITLPIVHTKNPVDGNRNIGMYRMQVFSNTTTGMHWHIHKTGAKHFEEYKKLGKKMPIAVCLGGDPVYTYCATAPLPESIDEYLLAGIIRNKKVKLVKCITQDIEVPEDVDIVLEGYIDPTEDLCDEGPFGDHTGFYSLPGKYPVFHLTAITHKKDAVYPATIVGIPPQEDYWFIKASERIFLPLMKNMLLNEIVDIIMPDYGVAHNLVVVQINARFPKQAYKVAHALWGIGQMMLNKILIISNLDIDEENFFEHIFKLPTWNDKLMLSYGPLDVLEHASLKPVEGGKIMLNAVIDKKDIAEINEISIDYSIVNQIFNAEVEVKYIKYQILVIFVEAGVKFSENQYQKLSALFQNKLNELRIFILDKGLKGMHLKQWAWHFMANFDPSVDFKVKKISNFNLLIFDGSIKVYFDKTIPNPTVSDNNTIDLIDKKWISIFNFEKIKSPSSIYQKLSYGKGYFANVNKRE